MFPLSVLSIYGIIFRTSVKVLSKKFMKKGVVNFMKKLDIAHRSLLICALVFVIYIAFNCAGVSNAYESVNVSDKEALTLIEAATEEKVEPADVKAEIKTVKTNKSTAKTTKKTSSSEAAKKTEQPIGIININTAGSNELQRLPGVGPATAEKIIAFREANGPFNDTRDIMLVSGIGEKKYEKMREYITVN